MPTVTWSVFLSGQQTFWQGSGLHRRRFRDPQMQLQADGREAVQLRVRVPEPHASVRVSPPGVSQRGALLQPGLHQTSLPRDQDYQDARQRLGPHRSARHQEGKREISKQNAGLTLIFNNRLALEAPLARLSCVHCL